MKNWKFDDGAKSGHPSIHLDNKDQVVQNWKNAYVHDVENGEEMGGDLKKYVETVKRARSEVRTEANTTWKSEYAAGVRNVRNAIHEIETPVQGQQLFTQ